MSKIIYSLIHLVHMTITVVVMSIPTMYVVSVLRMNIFA